MTDKITDEQLVKAFLDGSSAASDTLLERYQTPIWRLAETLSFTKDKPTIDDLSQEFWLRVFKRIREFTDQGPGSFKAWLYQICRNVCKESNRKLGRRPTPLSQVYPANLPDYLNTVRPEPSYDRTDMDRVKELLGELSEDDLKLLLLLYENTPYGEIVKIPPFEEYQDNLPLLRQRTCRLRRYLIELYKGFKQQD